MDGGTIKGYIDAIQRKCWAVERTSRKLSSLYGKWSWKANNEYDIVSNTLAHKVDVEDKKYRGKKGGEIYDLRLHNVEILEIAH